MPQVKVLNIGSLVLCALAAVMALSCSGTQRPQAAFTSVGRGAPVSPAIPWEMWRNPDDIEAIPPQEITGYPRQHWLVGPLDAGATGNRLSGFFGAAREGPRLTASSR